MINPSSIASFVEQNTLKLPLLFPLQWTMPGDTCSLANLTSLEDVVAGEEVEGVMGEERAMEGLPLTCQGSQGCCRLVTLVARLP